MSRRKGLAARLRSVAYNAAPLWFGALVLSMDTGRSEVRAARLRAGS
jgi:hypothetical protein